MFLSEENGVSEESGAEEEPQGSSTKWEDEATRVRVRVRVEMGRRGNTLDDTHTR